MLRLVLKSFLSILVQAFFVAFFVCILTIVTSAFRIYNNSI